jgi:hydroxymethylpyrimidine pyrophosphatase-like HAD family hydrolase
LAPAAYFRAVAVDFDGTLADDGTVAPDTLAALRHVRARRVTVVLVTGRILDELYEVFPDLDDHVDAVVAENGAVVSTPRGARLLAAPVDASVGEGLDAKGLAWRAGQVLLACSGGDEPAVLDVVRCLGFDYQLGRNRGELMVLPPGVTKGAGLFEVLGDLGLSHHNTLGVGDAENDHSLLETCEVGIAVPNAVDAVRAHADVVLDRPNGAGVTELLRGGLLTGEQHVYPKRWQVTLGVDAEGWPVTLPASQVNVVIAGGSGEGKSYLAGLIAEQLVGLGYSLFVFDPEGDHVGLGQLRGVLVVDANREATAGEVVQLIRHRYATVVVDLSGLTAAAQGAYVEQLPAEIVAQRAVTGLPQWVVLDEAQGPLARNGGHISVFDPAAKGYLLVTWRPEDLSADALVGVDAVVALGSSDPGGGLVDVAAAVAGLPRAEVARLLVGATGGAVLAWRQKPCQAIAFRVAQRDTPHLRHDRKYSARGVDAQRGFYFRTVPDTATGAIARNLPELEAELARCDRGVLRHHCPRRDFSRWVRDVFRDQALADEVATTEERVAAASPAAVVEDARVQLVGALQACRGRGRPGHGAGHVRLWAR